MKLTPDYNMVFNCHAPWRTKLHWQKRCRQESRTFLLDFCVKKRDYVKNEEYQRDIGKKWSRKITQQRCKTAGFGNFREHARLELPSIQKAKKPSTVLPKIQVRTVDCLLRFPLLVVMLALYPVPWW